MTHKIENLVAKVDREFIGIAESELLHFSTSSNLCKHHKEQENLQWKFHHLAMWMNSLLHTAAEQQQFTFCAIKQA